MAGGGKSSAVKLTSPQGATVSVDADKADALLLRGFTKGAASGASSSKSSKSSDK